MSKSDLYDPSKMKRIKVLPINYSMVFSLGKGLSYSYIVCQNMIYHMSRHINILTCFVGIYILTHREPSFIYRITYV